MHIRVLLVVTLLPEDLVLLDLLVLHLKDREVDVLSMAAPGNLADVVGEEGGGVEVQQGVDRGRGGVITVCKDVVLVVGPAEGRH